MGGGDLEGASWMVLPRRGSVSLAFDLLLSQTNEKNALETCLAQIQEPTPRFGQLLQVPFGLIFLAQSLEQLFELLTSPLRMQ